MLPALNVSALVVLVVGALKAAVTPAGTPVAASDTLPLELLRPETLMVAPALPFAGSVRLPADDAMLNVCFAIVSAMGVVLVVPPEVPCTVAVYVPGIAALLAVNVTVFWVPVAAEANAAVTPAGKPEVLNATPRELALKPATVISLAAPALSAETVRALGEDERVKLDAGIVTAMVVLPVIFPEVPVTTTMKLPATAVLLGVKVKPLL